MGRIYRKNDEGLYQVESTVSGEILHDKDWVTEDEMKYVILNEKFWDFMDSVVEVDLDFPNTYRINGEISTHKSKFSEIPTKDMFGEEWGARVDEILKRLGMSIRIGVPEKKTWRISYSYNYSGSNHGEVLVKGTKDDALKYVKEEYFPSQPEWLSKQIDLNKINADTPGGISIHEVEIKEV